MSCMSELAIEKEYEDQFDEEYFRQKEVKFTEGVGINQDGNDKAVFTGNEIKFI